MMKMIKKIVYIGLCFVFWACNDKIMIQNRVDLLEKIKEDSKNELSMNNLIEDYKIILLEDSAFLINSHQICAVTPTLIVLSDVNAVSIIDRNTGKVRYNIAHQGRGAGEYTTLSKCVVDDKTQSLYILDSSLGKLLQYSYNGEVIREITGLHELADFELNKDGTFLVCYKYEAKIPFELGIYDNNFELKKQFIKNKWDKPSFNQGLFIFNDIKNFNGGFYYQPIENDTVFNITNGEEEYGFTIREGNLKIPLDVMTDIKKKAERMNYIWGEYGVLSGSLYFSSYYHNNAKYQDIWNLDESDLLYRNIIKAEGSPRLGIKLNMGEKDLGVWPSFASGEYVYCMVNGMVAHSIFPQFSEDSNGFILELKMKKSYRL